MRQIRTRIHEWVIGALLWIVGSAPLCSAMTFTPVDRDQALDAARTAIAQKYPNADVVLVDSHQWVSYKADGTYTEWFETYVKILTEKGKRRYKTITSSFTIPYNTTEYKLVEVIRSDGTTLNVDLEKNSSEMIEQSQMDENIYDPNNRIVRVSIPEVNVGDVVHFIMRDEFTKCRMAGTFNDYVLLEGTDPIIRSRFTVVAPKDKPLQSIALKSEIKGSVTHTKESANGEIVYTWVARDVPQAFEEPQMPQLYTQVQRLLISTIPDWETVSKWYWNLCKPHIEATTPEMANTVKEITAGITDPKRMIEAVFRWVSQDIRYLGITVEKEAPGYEPHPVSMTFERRAGICRDKAALLVSMLRLAGFDAYPVLIMTGPKKDSEVPQPFFNHAISCVRKPDGTYMLMDSTDENTKQLFPAYLNDKSYLVAHPKGETLLTSAIIPAEQNMMHIETSGTLDKDGNLKAGTLLLFDGINDNAYRKFFSQLTPEERRQYLEKIVMRTAPGGVLTSFDLQPADMLDTSKRIEARIGYEVRGWAIPGKDTIMLPVLHFGRSVGMSNILIGKMGLKKRKYPYVTSVACGISEAFKLDMGDSVGSAVSLPEYETVDKKDAIWKTSLSVSDGTLLMEQTFKMKVPEYTPSEYIALQDTLKKIEIDNKKMPIFTLLKTQQPRPKASQEWYSSFQADAVVLDELHEYDIADASAWTEKKHVKMKVLTYAGKKNFSDLRIAYNPVWDKVQVKNAVVTSPAGAKTAINDKEINIMDADWVGDAHRYPASKIMVVSLPGVEEGSIIDYTVEIKRTGRSFFSLHGESCFMDNRRVESRSREDQSQVSMEGVFRYPEPIEKKMVRVRFPSGMKIHFSPIKTSGQTAGHAVESNIRDITVKAMHDGNMKVYEFSAKMIPPTRQEDYLPPWYGFNPVVFASSGSWKEYAHDVRNRMAKAASSSEKTAKATGSLLKNAGSSTEKIRLIRDFVAMNIRDIPTSFYELPPDRISSADQTLADGYGNSSDRAVVLYAMLKSAGLEPEFVLATWVSQVEDLRKPLYDYPAPHWFSDVLVRVRQEKGFIYLNDTDQYAALGTTKNFGHPGLVLSTGSFENIEPLPGYHDRSDTDISIDLSDKGGITMKERRTYFGNNYASLHKRFSEMPPEERKRHYEELVSSVSQSARPAGDYITSFDSYPGFEELSVQADSYAVRQSGYVYLKVPGFVNILEGVTSDERKNPLYQMAPRKARITVEVTLPDGVESCEVLPPDGLRLPIGPKGHIAMNTTVVEPKDGQKKKVVRIRQEISIEPAVIPSSGYPDLLETQRILSHPKANLLLLRMKDKQP